MFDESISICIGIVIIIFIICIFLLIFAPKSINFFDQKEFPIGNINLKDHMLETSVILKIEEDDNMISMEDSEKIELYKELYKDAEIKWEKYPDAKMIAGDVFILPLFMYSIIHKKNYQSFIKLMQCIKVVPDIFSIYFIKLNQNAKFIKHTGPISNNQTLRYIYCFNSYGYDDNDCGIWVNNEAKRLRKGDSYVYDSSKEHSLYNNTVDDVVFLIIDFKRPDNMPLGYSEYKMDDKIIEKFKLICGGQL